MSHLTADIICRTVFTTRLAKHTAHEVFEAFTAFERRVDADGAAFGIECNPRTTSGLHFFEP